MEEQCFKLRKELEGVQKEKRDLKEALRKERQNFLQAEEALRDLTKSLSKLNEEMDELTAPAKIRKELNLPFSNYEDLAQVFSDPSKRNLLHKYLCLMVGRQESNLTVYRLASLFVNKLFTSDFGKRCFLPDFSFHCGPQYPGRRFFLGEDVWVISPKVKYLIDDWMRTLQDRGICTALPVPNLRHEIRRNMRRRRLIWVRSVLPVLWKQATSLSSSPHIRDYYEIIYKDSAHQLMKLFHCEKPDLENPEEVKSFCLKNKKRIDIAMRIRKIDEGEDD